MASSDAEGGRRRSTNHRMGAKMVTLIFEPLRVKRGQRLRCDGNKDGIHAQSVGGPIVPFLTSHFGMSTLVSAEGRLVPPYVYTSAGRHGVWCLPLLTVRSWTSVATGTSSPVIVQKTITEKMLASETTWNAVVDYVTGLLWELRGEEKVTRGHSKAWTCWAPNSQSTPRDVMLSGKSAGGGHYVTKSCLRG